MNPLAGTGQFTPQLAIPCHGAVDFVPFHNSLASCGTQGDSLGARRTQEFENRFAHPLWILLRHDAAGVADDFRTFADIGRDARHAARHRFADDVRKAFGCGGADQYVEARVERGYVMPHTQPMKVVSQAGLSDPTPKIAGGVGLLFTRSDEVRVRNLIGNDSRGADERAMVLVLMQPPDQSDQWRVVGQSEFAANPLPRCGVGTQVAQIEAVRDDFEFLRRVADSEMRRASRLGTEHDAIRHESRQLSAEPGRPAHRPRVDLRIERAVPDVPSDWDVSSRELRGESAEQVAEVHPALDNVGLKASQVASQRQQMEWIRQLRSHERVQPIRNAELFEVLCEWPRQADREDSDVELVRPQPSQHASQHPFGTSQNDGVDDDGQPDALHCCHFSSPVLPKYLSSGAAPVRKRLLVLNATASRRARLQVQRVPFGRLFRRACSRQAENASTRVVRRRTFGTSGLKCRTIFATLAAVGTFRGNALSERPVGTLRLPAQNRPRLTDMPLPADDILSALHDGEVNSAERAVVEQRLATSAEARRESSEIRQVSALLKALPRERLPSEFPQQVLQAVEREMLIPSQRDDDANLRTRVAVGSAGSSRRWVGAVAVLTSAAGLLLLVRAMDDRSTTKIAQVRHEDLADSKQFGFAKSTSDASFGGGAAPLPMAAGPTAELRNSGALAGAAGTNSIAANAPLSAASSPSGIAVRDSDVLFFDHAALRGAGIGDVVRAMRTEGTEVAVVWLTIVDRQEGQAGLQLLLGNKEAAGAVAGKKADQADKPNVPADQLHAVFIETDAEQLTATLKQLRDENFLQSLRVDQPIELARLNEVGSGLESQSIARRFAAPTPSTADKKLAKGGATPKLAAKAEPSRAKESQDAKDQPAKQFAFEVSRDALTQNQTSQLSRNRGLPRTVTRLQTAVEKNAEQAPTDQRPMQVLFVVVDPSQAGKSPVLPSNSTKPTTPTAPSKARSEPAKPADKDGAA